MLLKYIYDPNLAQASYLVGCQQTGEALVIDPARDVTPYLQAAEAEGLTLAHITETHIHADFVSGARELAAKTGARLYLSDMGGDDWKYGFADSETIMLGDGDSFMVGNVRIGALHTPGHTPEHLMFQITDTTGANRPMGLFGGDCLFVGNVGRPDLLEEAAGFAGTKEISARGQFANVQKLKTMPDYLQVWPGHGAGSACGKGLGSIPSSTLGYEKLFNPAFHIDDEAAFVNWLLDDQPETPRYFARMKHVNKVGPALLDDLIQPARLTESSLLERLVDEHLVIDTRSSEAFAAGHILGAVNIPLSSRSFNSWAGWFVDYNQPTYLILDEADLPYALKELRAIGVDNVPGYFTPDALRGYEMKLRWVSPHEAHTRLNGGSAYLLDVRGRTEYHESRIPGARHLMMGKILDHLDDLPRDGDLIVQCGSGIRSQLVISLLQKNGFTNAHNLWGGIDGWKKSGLPIEEG